jgi:predicted Mrr-cat superfamily restriction endonuclease
MARAWLLRMRPLDVDLVPKALRTAEVSVGWGKADGLTDPSLTRTRFRDLLVVAYHREAADLRRAGGAAAQLWRFIRVMAIGDLILVPHGDTIHLARITGPVTYDPAPTAEHYAHRRRVEWLTGPAGVPRHGLPDELQTSLRSPRTCIELTRHSQLIHSSFPEAR